MTDAEYCLVGDLARLNVAYDLLAASRDSAVGKDSEAVRAILVKLGEMRDRWYERITFDRRRR